MKEARIVKIISDQYTVEEDGKPVVLKPRGKLRKNRSPVVGDIVQYDEESKSIEKVLPRKNTLLRPAVANVDQALIITSLKDPDFSDHLLNRLIFLSSLCDIPPAIVFTKWDLLDDAQKRKYLPVMLSYRDMGYPVFVSFPGSNDYFLKEFMNGKISVLSGQSGSGKSSLLNRLDPSLQLKTQEISKALGRGKHTTRINELYELFGGWLVDTPGFSSLDLTLLDLEKLKEKIKPFQPYQGMCKFDDCHHDHEPGCAVKQAIEEGKIDKSLYQDYLELIRATNLNTGYKKRAKF